MNWPKNQNNMNEKLLFDSFAGWYGYLWKACKTFVKGLLKIVYSLFGGMASVFVWLFRLVSAFCRREPLAAGIFFVVAFVLSFGWVSSYISGKVETRTAEYQRDSISLKLDKYLQAYDNSAEIVVGGDTIRYAE